MTGHPIRVYLAVFLGLLALTAATCGAAYLDLGRFNLVVALAIAATKATLVVVFFMRLTRGPRLRALALGGGLFWLGILFALALADLLTRRWGTYG